MKKVAKSEFVKTIYNRKARYEYEILETLEAGIALKGAEVKSIRQGKASLDDSFALLRNNEVTLENMQITPYEHATTEPQDPRRSRKLLLHKDEILKLKSKVEQKGLTLVPLKLYFNSRGIAKLELALVRGKKMHDKREAIKQRDLEREMRRGE
ncbi:MAG: SsrA-binding protein SmpB [Candidatus Thermochlorobacter aerophilum]|jgi:SsrA-binding protein|uniref:SsrA-binding protein n=1 Tax=Candidatus Thermochlorobacter aerophilus TaxID=1868324 RepID=A0A395M281_9BACT|nr:MAG: SsrA-binding protein SmpB [Candidatus Thermochlorobacter aerophilum]